jgi:hypothetical protein
VNSNQWYIVDNATALKTAKQKLRESRKGRPQAKNNSARTSFNGAAAATVSGAVGGTTCRTTMVASSTETVPS